MNACTKCGNKGEGRFCGKCGGKMEEIASSSTRCPACSSLLLPGAKFCGKCGAQLKAAPAPAEPPGPAPIRVVAKADPKLLRDSKIIWSLEPQVVAQRLSEDKMAALGGAKGIVIREGTRALIFADGKLLGEFTEGEYDFRDALASGPAPAGQPGVVRVGGMMGALRGLASWTGRMLLGEKVSADEARRRKEQRDLEKAAVAAPLAGQSEYSGLVDSFLSAVQGKKAIAVVLARSDDFHLIFNYPQQAAADLRVDVGVDLLMRVNDLTDFYRDFLMDTFVLTTGNLSARLGPILELEVAEAIKPLKVDQIAHNRQLGDAIETRFNKELVRTMPSVRVSRVFKLTANREEIAELERKRERLTLSERELSLLQGQNEFANRLRVEETKQQLLEASSDVELEKKLREVNKDKILNDQDFDKWMERLKLDRELTTARTQDEREGVLQELRKRELVREEDLEVLQGQSELRRGHLVEMFELRQQLDADRLRLEIDQDLGEKQLDLELARRRKNLLADLDFLDLEGRTEQLRAEQELSRQKLTDDYQDTRRDRDREQRLKDIDADQQEQLRQLDVAQRAQGLAQAARQQEHERELAELREVKRAEKELLEAEAQRWAGLSVEQIMAANPNISTEAAKALAERGSSAKAEEFARMQTEAAQKSKDEFKEMMRQQMEAQERMMRSMMDSNAAIAGAQMRAKDAEIERAASSADRTEERLTRVVSGTVGAVTGKPPSPSSDPQKRFCTSCGQPLEAGSVGCPKCGGKQT